MKYNIKLVAFLYQKNEIAQQRNMEKSIKDVTKHCYLRVFCSLHRQFRVICTLTHTQLPYIQITVYIS
jgi:hypothetical protein